MMLQLNTLKRRLDAKVFDWVGAIVRSKMFWTILVLKIIASFLFGSPVLTELFIPFIEVFVASPFSNPYDTFWTAGMDQNFPYPAAMLWIMSLPRLILYWTSFHDLPFNVLMFAYRLPLILADLAIFMVLCRWLRQQISLLVWLYWASPALFYITYLHGQLDVVPMALAFLSTYFLFSNRWAQSAILLALAVATKMHLVLILPFVLVYMWQSDRRLGIGLLYILIVFSVFLVTNLPYIFSDGFVQMVLLNTQQSKIWMITFSSYIDGSVFHIIPAILLALVFYSSVIQIKNRDLFLFFMGSAFCILVLFIPPAPGWYYWILPFLIYFYARLAPTFLVPIVALQVAYLFYFAVIPSSDFGSLFYRPTGYADGNTLSNWLMAKGLEKPLVIGLAFTALQTLVLINTGFMIYRGVLVQQQSKFRARPLMIGLSGDSGAGKTTLATDIVAVLGQQRVGMICGDDMHRWERGNTRWNELTHLNPLANELHDELDFIKQLLKNRRIWRRHYDHDTGKFTKELAVIPRQLMVLEGLHSFYLKPARDLFDLKVFIKLDPDLQKHRKVVRDTQKRGTTKKKVVESIKAREADLARFIEVQERHADILILTQLVTKIAREDIGNPNLVIQERLRITLSNAYFITPIVSDLMKIMPQGVRHFYDAQDKQVIELDYPPEIEIIDALGERHVAGLGSFGIYNPPWNGGWSGVMQLLITFCIFNDWEERR